MSLIPGFVHRRIAHRPNLVKIVDNIGWLFMDKILRMGVGLFVGVWVARYLGPEQFGLMNFALAFTGLFGAVAALGLQSNVVRDLVREPKSAPVILGTAAFLQLIGGMVAFLLVLVSIAYMRPDDALARSIVAILGSMMLLKASNVAVFWFESQVQSKYIVWVQNGAFLVFAAIKIALILRQAPLIAFVWAMLAEAIIVALMLLVVMSKLGPSLANLCVSAERAKMLLKDSWPLIFMGLMLSLYTKIDVVMVNYFLGDRDTGVYSVAVNIAELWFFVVVILVNSTYPAIIECHEKNQLDFNKRLFDLYALSFWTALFFSFSTFFLSDYIFEVLYGDAYSGAVDVFNIYVWAGIFVFMITASSRFYLLKNHQKGLLYRAAVGAVINISLNYFMLPIYGIEGAATATLITYFFVAYVYDFFDSRVTEQVQYKFLVVLYPWVKNKIST